MQCTGEIHTMRQEEEGLLTVFLLHLCLQLRLQ